jgi:hypothetical protein
MKIATDDFGLSQKTGVGEKEKEDQAVGVHIHHTSREPDTA